MLDSRTRSGGWLHRLVRRHTLVLLIALVAGIHGAAADPMTGKNLYLPYLGHLSLPATDYTPLAPGAYRIATRHYYLNEFRPFLDVKAETLERGEAEAINADYESYAGEVGLAVGVTERIRVGIDVRVFALYGGFLDGVIEGFHGVFGLPNSYRHYFARDEIVIDMSTSDGTVRTLSSAALRPGDIDLWTKAFLYSGSRLDLAATVALKVPVPDPNAIVSSGRPDAGAGLDARLAWSGRLSSHASAGIVVPLEARDAATRFPRPMLNALAGLAWRATERLDAVVELRFATPPYVLDRKYLHPLFGVHRMYTLPQTNLTVGFRRRFEAGTFEFYVEEDFLTWEGADIVVAAAWRSPLR